MFPLNPLVLMKLFVLFCLVVLLAFDSVRVQSTKCGVVKKIRKR